MITLLFAAALTVCSPCVIQNVKVEVGNGTTLDRTSVTINGGRIVAIGESAPEGATIIDGSGQVLAPGFIETRSVVGITEVDQEHQANDAWAKTGVFNPGFAVAWGFNPASVWIPVVREEGVTSAVIAPHGGVLEGTGAWVDLTGTVGSIPDPLRPSAMFGDVGSDVLDQAGGARGMIWLALRQAFADARFYQQNRKAFDKGEARPLSLSTLQLEALQPVLDGTIPLVLEANRASDILTALTFARNERIRLVIAGGAEAWKVASSLVYQKVPVMLRPSVQLPETFDQIAARDDLATLLDRAGVTVIIATGGNAPETRRLRQEAGIAVANGLAHSAAIRAITLNAAEAFGRGKDYGSVTTGKRANLVLWSGDPLETTSFAERVWIDGEERSLDTRQRELVQRYRTAK